MLALAAVAFAIGAVAGADRGAPASYTLAEEFVRSWTHGDYAAMYGDITPSAQRSTQPSEFAEDYGSALRTATAVQLSATGRARSGGGSIVTVPVQVRTRLWGTIRESFSLPIASGPEGQAKIAWTPSLTFPGVASGQVLSRSTSLPRRATLLARNGTVLAEGSALGSGEGPRSSPLGSLAGTVVGEVGPVPASRRKALEAEGVPPDASVGVSGLELALDDSLRGVPGGQLMAGGRVLASSQPRPADPLRTSVSPSLQSTAVSALGGQLGGIVAMQPSTGQILAVAGIGLDGLQPPGSTFKIITLTGVLQAKIANPHTVFPYATYATLDGVRLNNANGEECGGSLELAFAVSCNSVFSPLGAKLGSARLVAAAERFGFNHPPGVPGAAESTLPAASGIQGELDIGSTAIGQGQVLATPLEMATVAAAIADGGHLPTPTFLPRGARPGPAATSAEVARTVRRLMIGVVRNGTGTAAAIPGVVVAGKTGTAELKSACTPRGSSGETASSEGEDSESCHQGESEASNTDAWFAAFAPALHPRIAVCVLLVKDGAGGATAAPVARQVLEAGLSSGG